MSRFGEIYRWELGYLARRPSTWIYFVLLFAMGLLSMLSIDPGSSSNVNAPLNIAGRSLIMAFMGVLVTAGLFGDAGSRDLISGMHPLFYTAPLRKAEYLGGRFLGALTVNALLLLAAPLSLMMAELVPIVDPERMGPFRLVAYVQPYLVMMLPNLLVNAAVLFALTVLSRRSFPSYLGAIALFMGYVIAVFTTTQIRHSSLAMLLDPTGFVAIDEIVSDWTPVEQNTRLIGESAPLMWNRLVWLLVGAAMAAFTLYRFRFAHQAQGQRRRRNAPAEEAAARPAPVTVPSAPRSFGAGARLRQTLALTGRAFREILVSRDFAFVVAGLLVFIFALGSEIMADDRYGVPAWPLTQHVTSFMSSFFVGVIISLLTAFYAGELVWRERDAGISMIVDAAPVPDWVGFLAKFLALALMLAALQAVLTGAGMMLQALNGFYRFEPGLYLRVMFGLQMADYLLLAVVAMLVHALVNQKYVGHVVVVLFYLATVFAGKMGIRHNLLVYGGDPGWTYSDMSGFGPFIAPFVWFKLYWAAWALLIAVAAGLFWVRGTETGARRRIRLAGRRFTRPMMVGTAAAALLITTLGGFVFYNTNVLNEYRDPDHQNALRVGYEKRYKRFENIPQPWQTHAKLRVELYPEERRVAVQGTYRLVNRSAQPMDSVHLSLIPEMRIRRMEFDRLATAVVTDDPAGYRIYRLAAPLQPGDSMRLSFDLRFDPRGFPNSGIRTAVVGNGTFVPHTWLPSIGYQRDFELPSTAERKKFGLARRDYRPSISDLEARKVARTSSNSDFIHLETVIGTTARQTAVAPGALRRSWMENGRRYFHYETEAPVLNFYAFLSAEYSAHEATWNGVQVKLLHHPTHGMNRDRVVRSVKASLDYFTRNFGPYPHRQLTLVEFPRYQAFARAYPGMVVFAEGSSLLARPDTAVGHFDSPFMVTAHEVAHQWWGHQLMGADVQGSQVLSETMAQYGALMVMKRTHPMESVHDFLETMQIEYLNRRGTHANPEVPLMLSGDHDFLHYRKGAVVMYALQDYLGEDRVNTALGRLMERHRYSGPPYPTTLDLHRELLAVTPDSLKYLLDDLFTTITLWDLRAQKARAVPAGGGAYTVTVPVEARKVRSDSVGNITEVPMNDWVEIGVFAEAEDGERLGRPLYLRKHRIRSGQQTVTVTVQGRPARAGIDPYHTLINLHKEEMHEKVQAVEVAG